MNLTDELRTLESVTFEVEEMADFGMEAAGWCSSSCSCSSCCSCSTSGCCSTATSTSGCGGG